MTNYTITLQEVTKIFGRRLIFDNIDYEFSSGSVYGLAGKNGSGKSTLAKIIAGILSATRGKVIHKLDENTIIPENLHDHLGFVSPYLVLYDEFTAGENLVHFSRIRGNEADEEKINFWLNKFNLYERRNDLLKGFSSGMKQRMKIIFALLHDPQLIIFDEPTSNLDNEGKDKVYEIINEQGKENTVIVASNEDSDLALCSQVLQVEEFKNEN
jgi:heme exporter protein A